MRVFVRVPAGRGEANVREEEEEEGRCVAPLEVGDRTETAPADEGPDEDANEKGEGAAEAEGEAEAEGYWSDEKLTTISGSSRVPA